jgi:hypothetical protein
METGRDAGRLREDRMRSSDQSREHLSVFTEVPARKSTAQNNKNNDAKVKGDRDIFFL